MIVLRLRRVAERAQGELSTPNEISLKSAKVARVVLACGGAYSIFVILVAVVSFSSKFQSVQFSLENIPVISSLVRCIFK